MFGIHDFWLFLASGLLLNITPGADMLYTLNSSGGQGFKAGVAAALGVSSGILVHVLFAMVGLSALLATSATAFMLVKYLGAAYLLYLGLKLLLERNQKPETYKFKKANYHLLQVYQQGIFINILNPKIALFFLAFLPQFINTQAAHTSLAFLVLGLTFSATGLCVNSVSAWLTHSLAQRLTKAQVVGFWLKKLAGCMFIGLGLRLALETQAQ